MRGEDGEEEEERILSPLFFLPFPSISPLSSLENLDPATLETSPPSASPSPFSPLRLSLPFLPPPPNQKKTPKGHHRRGQEVGPRRARRAVQGARDLWRRRVAQHGRRAAPPVGRDGAAGQGGAPHGDAVARSVRGLEGRQGGGRRGIHREQGARGGDRLLEGRRAGRGRRRERRGRARTQGSGGGKVRGSLFRVSLSAAAAASPAPFSLSFCFHCEKKNCSLSDRNEEG